MFPMYRLNDKSSERLNLIWESKWIQLHWFYTKIHHNITKMLVSDITKMLVSDIIALCILVTEYLILSILTKQSILVWQVSWFCSDNQWLFIPWQTVRTSTGQTVLHILYWLYFLGYLFLTLRNSNICT